MYMLKNIGFTVLSIVVAVVVIMVVQQINLILFPLPEWVDANNPEHLTQIMANLPLGALLMVELSYLLGSLAAGFVLAKATKRHSLKLILVVGGVLTLAGIANLLAIPHPAWLAILTTVTYIPAVWFASRVVNCNANANNSKQE